MSADARAATPVSPEFTVREARDTYLRENGFSLEMYSEPSFAVPVGPWTLRLPNPPERQRVIGKHVDENRREAPQVIGKARAILPDAGTLIR